MSARGQRVGGRSDDRCELQPLEGAAGPRTNPHNGLLLESALVDLDNPSHGPVFLLMLLVRELEHVGVFLFKKSRGGLPLT